MNLEKIKTVLIVQTAFLGDIVLTIPLINNLKQIFPNKKLIVLTTLIGKEILKDNQFIDEILVYDKNGKDSGFKKFFSFIHLLKLLSIDLAIVPHRSLRSAMLVYFANIPYRFGFDISQGRLFFNRIVKYKKGIHDLERNLMFLEDIVGKYQTFNKNILFSYNNSVEKYTGGILQENGFLGHKIIGIHVGSKWFTKKWPAYKFIDLIDKLDKIGNKVIVFGDKDDVQINNYLKFKKKSDNILNLIANTSIDEMISFLRVLSVYVSNDSGPMHIAAAFGLPVLGIFGPTTKSLGFYPYNHKSKIIEIDLKCRPCGLHGGKVCPKKHFRCMNDISVDSVLSEIELVIKKIPFDGALNES